ncbi:hypothetical protein [Bradyrhizobium sp. USDA 241]|uniref:hypothetical protein n=1 Tax=Bradyrhizobium sp. USDA 241 TaxID=3377725 RepID=UPI003C71A0E5
MKRLALCISAIAIRAGDALAEEYPYREPSYYRTVFIDSAVRKCLRDEGSTSEVMHVYCECKATGVATFITQRDLDEMMAGGLHVTPRYLELADKAERQCYKIMTGKDLN